MSKHTKGDWYTKREGRSTVYVFCLIGGGLVQEVAACGPTNEGQEQQEANARLISAAPELLEALVDVMFRHVPFSDKSPYAEKARAVIAKATGEQS